MIKYKAVVEAHIDLFIAARVRAAPRGRVYAGALFDAYREWEKTNPPPYGIEAIPVQTFGRVMGERYLRVRDFTKANNPRLYIGISLAEMPSSPTPA